MRIHQVLCMSLVNFTDDDPILIQYPDEVVNKKSVLIMEYIIICIILLLPHLWGSTLFPCWRGLKAG